MEINELKKAYKEEIIKIRLAHYKRLSADDSFENNKKAMLIQLKRLLLEDGITEEFINQVVLEYKMLSDEERQKEIEEKIEILVSQVITYLENSEEISSKDYPEIYHRIQELVALNTDLANELIKEAFAREHINRCTTCGGEIFGEPCTYYFSKKLTY